MSFRLKVNPGSFRSCQKMLQNRLETDYVICKVQYKVNYKVCCLFSNRTECIILKDGHQRLLREGGFYSKYKYHHVFCWMSAQSVLNNILTFPSFHYQHWNQDMSLISRLYQICAHSHKLLRDATLQNYVHIYY